MDDRYEAAERHLQRGESGEALLAAGSAAGAWETLRAIVGDEGVGAIAGVDVATYDTAVSTVGSIAVKNN